MTGASNMKTSNRSALSLLLFLLPACGGKLVEFPKADGGRSDTTKKADVAISDVLIADVLIADAPIADVLLADAPIADAPIADAPIADAPTAEAGNRDTGNVDTSAGDAGITDLRNRELGSIDGAKTDTANSDAPNIDAPVIDAAKIDAANIEAGNTDVGNIDGSGPGPAIVVDLGLASPFAIAATAGVTNTNTTPITHINGNVVLSPNQTCNAVPVGNAGDFGLCGGMPPTISGTVITDTNPDTTTAAAIKADLNAAFLRISPLDGAPVGLLGGGTPIDAPTTLGNVAGSALVLGDNWFTPGVYKSITSILITGDITLDGQGDPNAVFVFQSASTLGTADGDASPAAHTRILLTNGTKASNVWWQVSSSATIGTYTEFQGNILAKFSITMKTHATACGRSMAGAAGAGAFVFDSNVVSVPGNGCPL
jgi:hypothetical protein